MRRRRFTVGRAFALLIMGVAVGAGLFLARTLDPTGIEVKVREALGQVLENRFELEAVVPRLGRGVELLGLRIFYPDGSAAVHVERALLYVDHERLLEGSVDVPRIELTGLTLTLRAGGPDRAPGLPRVFRESRAAARTPARVPEISLPRGGRNRLVLEGLAFLRTGDAVELEIEDAEGLQDGATYRIEAALKGETLGRAGVTITYDPLRSIVAGRLHAPEIGWTEGLFARLSDDLRARLAAVRVRGRADAVVEAHVDLADRNLDYLFAHARLEDVEGRFGNLYARDPAGFPFGFRRGNGLIVLDAGRLKIHYLEGVYVSRDGREGMIGVQLDVPLDRASTDLDFQLTGRGLHATPDELRLLLSPDAVETVVDKYEPGGTLELDLRVARRLGLRETVRADLRLTDGRFEYAGMLDEATGRRYGFRYPLEGCEGHLVYEGGVRTGHGLARVVTLRSIRGRHRLRAPPPGRPPDVSVTATGRRGTYAQHPGEPEDVEVNVHLADLPIDDDLAAAFASTREGVPYRTFELSGNASSVRIRVHRDAFHGNVPLADYEVGLDGCSLCYRAFPLHIDGLSGTIVSRAVTPGERAASTREMELVQLAGRARDGGRVTASGRVHQQEDGREILDVRIRVDDLLLGPDLESAVAVTTVAGRPGGEMWRKFRPAGRIDAEVYVRSAESADIDILLDGGARLQGYGAADYPVGDLKGTLSYRDGALTLRGIEATLPSGSLTAEGEVRRDGTLELEARAHGLGCDSTLLALLLEAHPAMHAVLASIEPGDGSVLDIAVEVSRAAPGEPVRFTAVADRIALHGRLSGLAMRLRGGPARLTADGFTTGELWLDAGAAQLHVRESDVKLGKGAGTRVLFDARGIHPVDHIARLLGPDVGRILGDRLRVDIEAFELLCNRSDGKVVLAGAVDLRRVEDAEGERQALEPTGAFELAPVTIAPGTAGGGRTLSGLVRFRGLDMHLPAGITNLSGQLLIGEGTLGPRFSLKGAVVEGEFVALGRMMRAASLNLTVDPHYVRLSDFDARFYEGALSGSIEVHLGEPEAFRVRIRANDVDLGEFLRGERPSEDPMGGKVDFALDLQSPSGDPRHLAGRGEVDVREGALFEVPFFRTVLSLLGRVAPIANRPRFRNAAIDFTVRGETIEVSRLHLSTAVSDIYGRGEATIYGDLDLVIDPQVTRILDLPRFLNIPVLSALRNLLHRTVYEVKLGGTIESPRLHLRALPFLKDSPRAVPPSPHGGLAERLRPDVLP